jgi:hypothetical protein
LTAILYRSRGRRSLTRLLGPMVVRSGGRRSRLFGGGVAAAGADTSMTASSLTGCGCRWRPGFSDPAGRPGRPGLSLMGPPWKTAADLWRSARLRLPVGWTAFQEVVLSPGTAGSSLFGSPSGQQSWKQFCGRHQLCTRLRGKGRIRHPGQERSQVRLWGQVL